MTDFSDSQFGWLHYRQQMLLLGTEVLGEFFMFSQYCVE